jgi:Tfp pilus assembly protein PilW
MSHAGVSVIELMVAMAISLILLLGIVNIFIGSKESYRARENISMMQETARFGLESLTSAILMADHWGGVRSSDISISATGLTGGSGDCDSAWITNIGQAIFGADGKSGISSVTGFADCVTNNKYIVNSDVLILRYAAGQPIINSGVQADTSSLHVRTSTGEKGTLFKGGVDPVAATGLSDQDGTNNYQYRVEAYYLRPCSVTTGGCIDGIPTLVRLVFVLSPSGGQVTSEALVNGVEQIQYQYGIDASGDGQVEQFASATSVSNWNQVVAVRIDMLVRTESEDPDYQDATATYTLAGGTADNGLVYTVPTSGLGFHRKRLTKVVQIRNRTRF